MKKIKILLIICLMLIALNNVISFSIAYDKNCQSWQNSYGNLTVCPKTCYNAIHQKQYWYLDSYVTQEIDIVFRFNFSLTKGGLYYWNNGNYTKVNVNHIEINNYHYYYITNFNVIEDKNYSGYWFYDVPIGSVGKYDMYVKFSSDPIGTWRIHLDPYWDSNYHSRYDLYVNSSQVNGDLENFPTRVYIDDNIIIGSVCQNDLDDIVFVDTTNTTVLNYELENYSFNGNKLSANYFVNITDISHTTNTHFNLYFNNSGAISQENATGVWDTDYLAVFHMNQPNGGITDSTSYGNDFDEGGTPTYYSNGLCGYGIEFDGNTDFFENNVMDLTSLDRSTIECFHASDVVSGGSGHFVFGSKYNDNDDWRCSLYTNGDDSSGHNYQQDDGTIEGGYNYVRTIVANEWIYYAMTSTNDGTGQIYGYFNTEQEVNDSTVNFDYSGLDNKHRIGCRYVLANSNYYDGTIDEFRVSKIDRSKNWITVTYNTMINFTGDNSFIIWGNATDLYLPPNLIISNIFPSNNSYWCNYIVNLTNLSVTVNNPYGTNFDVDITFLDNIYSWSNVGNGTFNISLLDKIPIGKTNYSWILNVTARFCVPSGGDCFFNNTYYFNVCWDALIYMQVSNLDIDGAIDTAQFFIILMFISWLIITLLNYFDINNPEVKRNQLFGLVHVLFSAPLIFYFASHSFINGLLYGYVFTLGFIITTFYIVSVQYLGD